jgi:hypothetical protein
MALTDLNMSYLVLATASDMFQKQVGHLQDESVETASYQLAALQLINSRLQDPVEMTSEGLICAIIALVCGEVGGLNEESSTNG